MCIISAPNLPKTHTVNKQSTYRFFPSTCIRPGILFEKWFSWTDKFGTKRPWAMECSIIRPLVYIQEIYVPCRHYMYGVGCDGLVKSARQHFISHANTYFTVSLITLLAPAARKANAELTVVVVNFSLEIRYQCALKMWIYKSRKGQIWLIFHLEAIFSKV